MTELFRFLVMRQPDDPGDGAATALSADSALGGELTQASDSTDPQSQMSEVADRFLASDQAVISTASLGQGGQLSAFAADLQPTDTADRVAQLAQQHFDQPLGQLARSDQLTGDKQRLSDTLLALPLSTRPTGALPVVDLFRAIEVIQTAAGVGSTRVTAHDAAQLISRPVVLPESLFPVSSAPQQQPTPVPDPAVAENERRQQALVQEAERLANVLSILSEVPVGPGAAPAVHGNGTSDTVNLTSDVTAPPVAVGAAVREPSAAGRQSRLVHQSGGIIVRQPIIDSLPVEAQHVLSELDPQVRDLPIAGLTNLVRVKLSDTIKQVDHSRLGGWLAGVKPVSAPSVHDEATDPPPGVLAAPPSNHGAVAPAGIADLLVVRQHVVRYEPGEVAYVENVAVGEEFTRTTTRGQSTQNTVTIDLTTTDAQERDTQATSRFDLNSQTSSLLQEDNSSISGSPSSGAYGAVVQAGGSKQNASNTATSHGQDVTSRAAAQLTQQYHSQSVSATTNTFEEDITHHFDNTAGTKDEIAVYQWLDKVSQAQVFSYGKRLMYDINVPEPAAFLLRALDAQVPGGLTLQRPLPLPIQADELDELNYLYYGAGYGASGLQPPPDQYTVTSLQWPFAPKAGDGAVVNTADAQNVTIPAGYAAAKAVVSIEAVYYEIANEGPAFYVNVGKRQSSAGLAGGWWQTLNLDGETGNIPVSVIVDGVVYQCTVNIEIVCSRTPAAFEAWQLHTYDVLLQASRDRMAEYESALSALQTQLKLLTFGQTERRKRQLERAELQKATLSVLTNQQFDGLSAIEHSPQGYPQPFLPNVAAIGRYVRFLQEAFEWDQMTYLFYPYFWGRKPYWIDRVLLEDTDEQFADFLRAGSARVMVPVRPGFEGVVGTFMSTGNVPTTAALGQLTSAQYLPFLAELQGESLAGLDTAVPYGPPWEVRLPTSLTVVRKDASLPRWKEQTTAGKTIWLTDGADALV